MQKFLFEIFRINCVSKIINFIFKILKIIRNWVGKIINVLRDASLQYKVLLYCKMHPLYKESIVIGDASLQYNNNKIISNLLK